MLPLASLIDQKVEVIPTFTLECGAKLHEVPIAFKTWGRLNEARDNVMIICHAFTGSSDVEDWWGPLMGPGKAFDPNRFFIFCANVLGSPYGSASPITGKPDTGEPYGPEFPPTTIRDDVRFVFLKIQPNWIFMSPPSARIHKLVLDRLGVSSVAVVIGGSMGGMAVLEWPLCTPPEYVRHIIPLATSARHSAWCISWGEAQRQSIYSDPGYNNGYYTQQPASGLAAARMSALLTYRSRDSFESRFGRRPQQTLLHPQSASAHSEAPSATNGHAAKAHNDGNRSAKIGDPESDIDSPKPPIFSAQSYLRYQGAKFTARFDANCYIHITRKLDTHDVTRGRMEVGSSSTEDESVALARVLSTLPPRALIISIQTDGLFTTNEQRELAEHIPDAELVTIPSPDGHDGFLLEFEQINTHILRFLKREFPELYQTNVDQPANNGFEIKKSSVFGEAEVDITSW